VERRYPKENPKSILQKKSRSALGVTNIG